MEDVKTGVEETVDTDVVDEAVETDGVVEEDDISNIDGYDYEEDDLEYDDEGNVVIPDDDAEADTTAKEGEEPPKEEAPDPRDEELSRLRARFDRLEAQAKGTLKSLGYEGDDALEGLTKLAAESEGKTHEEYKAAQEAEARRKEAEALLQKQELDKMIAEDLAAVQAEIKGAEKYNSVLEFPNFRRFGELRDLGLSPVEAFRASHPDIVAESVAKSTRAVADSKSHLRSTVPKAARDTSVTIPSDELETYRELFPGASDKELTDLYRRSTKK